MAAVHRDCAGCVAAGFGWSARRHRCGNFANVVCPTQGDDGTLAHGHQKDSLDSRAQAETDTQKTIRQAAHRSIVFLHHIYNHSQACWRYHTLLPPQGRKDGQDVAVRAAQSCSDDVLPRREFGACVFRQLHTLGAVVAYRRHFWPGTTVSPAAPGLPQDDSALLPEQLDVMVVRTLAALLGEMPDGALTQAQVRRDAVVDGGGSGCSSGLQLRSVMIAGGVDGAQLLEACGQGSRIDALHPTAAALCARCAAHAPPPRACATAPRWPLGLRAGA